MLKIESAKLVHGVRRGRDPIFEKYFGYSELQPGLECNHAGRAVSAKSNA